MAQLAQATQLSRATIYRRVGNKAALLRRLAQERGTTIPALHRPDIPTRILQSARVIFGQQSIATATIEAIAQEAGVGVATVYRHFGDKERLIKAFVEKYSPRRTIQEYLTAPDGDIESNLEQIALLMLTFFYDNRDIMRLTFAVGETQRQLLGQINGASERTLDYLSRYFEQQMAAGQLPKGDAQDTAVAFIGLLLSFSFIAPLHYNQTLDQPEKTARFTVKLFLDGVRAPQTAGETS